MKIFAITAIPMFVLFALVQVNDPDPYIWMPVYLIPAAFSYLYLKGKFPVYAGITLALTYLAFSVWSFPPSLVEWAKDEISNGSMSMKTPSMEEARESLGSLICFVFLAIYAVSTILKRRNHVSNPEKAVKKMNAEKV